MSKIIDLTGLRFGRLTVLYRAENHITPCGSVRVRWNCLCDCGNTIVVTTNSLRSSRTKSCGCLFDDTRHTAAKKHGYSHERLYGVWCSIKERCTCQTSKDFKDYGGRGIAICCEWLFYPSFREWAYANGYAEGKSIDRIDVNGGYSPTNCRWVDQKTQANNKRSNRLISHNGSTKTLAQWASETGINAETIADRLRHGWSVERALNEPPRRNGKNE